MVFLNKIEYEYRPGMLLKDLVDDYNKDCPKLAFDGFAILINGIALTELQAQERILLNNDNILIVPLLAGG